MYKRSLTALARQQLTIAQSATSGRSASTVYGGHENILRQTMIALAAGHKLSEHENPGEATVHVLKGRVRLGAAGNSWEGSPGICSSSQTVGTTWKHSTTPSCC